MHNTAICCGAYGSYWHLADIAKTGRHHRDLIITLAARHKIPAVYFERNFVGGGGLISYGPDFVDQCRRAAGCVDRILKGEKPADLPVQAPIKYELVINLRWPRRSVSLCRRPCWPAPTR